MNWLLQLLSAPSPLRTRRGMDIDFPLLAGSLALLGLGLVMITSASSEVAAASTGNPLYYMIRHLVYLSIGFGAAFLTLLVPMSFWQRNGAKLMMLAFALLVMVLLPVIGREVNGAKRWIGFGMFNVQPSELAKLFTVMFIAGYMVRRQVEVQEKLMGFIKPMMVLGPIAVLLLAEPDFGATVVLVGSCIAMLFLGGANLIRFVLLAGAVVGAGVLVMTSQSYRMQRLTNFIDPWADQYGAGYQLSQSLIAFGRGEWFGVGLGNSIQKQFYLPEAHTDFIFAVLAEELGMVGALVTVALFVFVSVRALCIGLWAEKAKQYFSAYVAYGLSFLWIGQIVINIGVNIGRLPTKGLTLPFLSYGGSSLVICCVSLAILLRIEWERRTSLGNEEIEFSEEDFADVEEVARAR
ncbi:putative lipid II flippase FtsW [Pseudomonas sp. LRF_L74]|uniref:putative lipid II flippase FtsW n=1 Tax=Pseudomonas sp. LRF_L74 TaxID=3369422 RepID=UPI003F621836